MNRPLHLWIIGAIALIWYSVSVADYLLLNAGYASYLALFSPEQLDYLFGFPLWVDLGWALAVWGGLAGAILLLARSKRAGTAFTLSVLGMAMGAVWQAMHGAVAQDGASLFVSALIWIVALALVGYSIDMRRRGVLR